MKPTKGLEGREILVELVPVGQFVKAMAVDTATDTEVSIQGPKSASPAVLQNNAMRRLEYVLRKNGHLPPEN